MAITLTLTDLSPIYPAYTDDLQLNVSAGQEELQTDFTVQFDVYINRVVNNFTFYDLIDSFKYPINPNTVEAQIDLSPILSTQFTSVVHTPAQSGLIEFISDGIKSYYVNVTVFDGDNNFVESGTTGIKYIFNGCANLNENFEMGDFIMSYDNNGNFLTNYNADRNITIDGAAYLQTITGDYGTGLTSSFGGVIITRHQSDLSTSGISTITTNTDKRIVNIDLSPDRLNSFYPNFIDDDTEYITVDEINGYNTNTIKTIIIKEHKLRKFYTFIYVNRLGGMDYFTAVKVSDDNYKIKKKLLNQFVIQKPYYTKIERSTSVLTQFITSEQSDGLKELFSSPAVKLLLDDILYDVRIINSRVVVRDRYPKSDFIQHEIEFEYNNKYFTQQY